MMQGKKTSFYSKILPKIHQQLLLLELTKNRRLRYDLYVMVDYLVFLTCLVQMLVLLLVRDRLYLSLSLVSSQKYSPSRMQERCPSPTSKTPPSTVFLPVVRRIPVTRPARNVVRRKMPILFFSG